MEGKCGNDGRGSRMGVARVAEHGVGIGELWRYEGGAMALCIAPSHYRSYKRALQNLLYVLDGNGGNAGIHYTLCSQCTLGNLLPVHGRVISHG